MHRISSIMSTNIVHRTIPIYVVYDRRTKGTIGAVSKKKESAAPGTIVFAPFDTIRRIVFPLKKLCSD